MDALRSDIVAAAGAARPVPARALTFGLALAGLAIALGAPHLVYPVFLMKVLCFALFAAAFNLLVGYVGLLSFGHAAFFGCGAYASAHALKVWGWPPEAGMLFGAGIGALLGVAMGFLAIRRQGIYFSMITLALAQMIFFVCLQVPFTGGEDGIQNVPRGHLLGGLVDLSSNVSLYYVVLAVTVFGLFFVWRVVNSPFGAILQAIRENETRAVSLGYRVERYKLAAFVMSASLAGLAGGTKALVFQLATLTDVAWQMSGEVILMTLLGGIGTLPGPVIGAMLLSALEHYFSTSSFPVTILTGMVFMACVLLFRRGIVGEVLHRWKRRRAKEGGQA